MFLNFENSVSSQEARIKIVAGVRPNPHPVYIYIYNTYIYYVCLWRKKKVCTLFNPRLLFWGEDASS